MPEERESGTGKGDNEKFLVAMRLGETPVPIPNTMVKTQAADGTALETVWESRWLPEYMKNLQKQIKCLFTCYCAQHNFKRM